MPRSARSATLAAAPFPFRSSLTRIWRNETVAIHQQMKLARRLTAKEMTFQSLRPRRLFSRKRGGFKSSWDFSASYLFVFIIEIGAGE